MPNIAALLKAEIARVARKQVRQETAGLKQGVARQRSEIAALKRQVADLSRELRAARRQTRVAPAASDAVDDKTGLRFRAKGLASHRHRLGLSAAELGKLLGVSGQSVYLWEAGKARPRASLMPAIAALRTMGKRQAAQLLSRQASAK
jgi:DNA-binding XRE family transcriptional regulator